MVAAVKERSLDIDDLVASQYATLQRFENALLDWLDVLLAHYAPLDVVDKLEAFARLIGLDSQLTMRVVAGSSRLPYVPGFRFGRFANGFQINNRGLTDIGLQVKFAREPVADRLQRQLVQSDQNRGP